MGRARNPARDKAYNLWAESDGKAQIKDIAATLGVPDSRVRKWKSEDKWEQKIKEQSKKERSEKPLRKKGAQPGNKNAVGNKGGGPVGNQKAIKHGGYAKLLNEDVFSDDELEYFGSEDETDEEFELVKLIRIYVIREHRLLKAINKYEEEMAPVLSGQNRFEKKRHFASDEEKEQYQQRVKEKVAKGERLPGESYDIQIYTEPRFKRIERLEAELTKVQRAKKEAIAALYQIRADRTGSVKNAIALAWIESFAEEDDEDVDS